MKEGIHDMLHNKPVNQSKKSSTMMKKFENHYRHRYNFNMEEMGKDMDIHD